LHTAETKQRGPTGLAISQLPMRLVIVADNALTIQAIRAGLRGNSAFTLVGHADPLRTSARVIVGVRPDVVLLDDMDRCDQAIDLIRELSSEDETVRVIVLSSELDEPWLARLFDAGATGAISKETHPRVVGMLLSETLKGHVFHRFACMRPSDAHAYGGATTHRLLASEKLRLTSRQLEILRLVAAGSTNSDIAQRLWVTEQTVKFHLRNIFRKLGVANRTEASHVAHVNGLVSDAPTPAITAAVGFPR
jgi:DNA-binding NarL/FixJ family response regulator